MLHVVKFIFLIIRRQYLLNIAFSSTQIGDNKYPPSNGDSLLVIGNKAPEPEKNVFCTSITDGGAILPLG